MAYSRVLVAVEANDEAHKIIKRAKAFAADAEISVIAVVPDMVHAYGNAWTTEATGLMMEFIQGARREAKTRLVEIAKEEGIAEDHLYVREGRPASVVHELREEIDADCIVAGTHGQSGVELIFGSTANALIHGLECDAYLIRMDED